MMKRAIVFPGQGSQMVGMGRDFAETFPECRTLFDQANEILNFDLASICFKGPQEELNKSNRAQVGLFVASTAVFKAWELRRSGLAYDLLAGHSLGEWTALYIAGVVSFEDTLKVLKARGEYMQAACKEHPGAMLAVINLDSDRLVEIADSAGCYVANFNSLSQTVLSGTVEAIYKAEALSKEAGAKRTVRLPVFGAFHSPLMQSAADQMNAFLAGIDLFAPRVPVLSNVTAEAHDTAGIRDGMVRQITSAVQWVASVRRMIDDGIKEIVECGPGSVLASLIKRIDKTVTVRSIGRLADLENVTEEKHV